ncbi:MurR/RpiR family transcriptional regulator [Sphingosinicella sp.]|uniref:MurR/RpiR family transcriptional regulator n=1 Tax=Sphingosinicella sp. TaxID=1917971 RepID=UPI0035AF601C
MQVRDILTQPDLSLTPSEQRVVQVLLNEYPIAGLESASNLARKAAVSDPTITRLITKLGFTGFAQFQASLLGEVEERLRSPLMMIDAKRGVRADEDRTQTLLRSVARTVDEAANAMLKPAYDRAAELILESKGRAFVLGGRFSRHVGGMLAAYLHQLRPRVTDVGALADESFDLLLDVDRRDVLVVFDYRRYQNNVIRFAWQASERGARIVLFTDIWMSPIAEIAETVIISQVEVESPYDSLAAPVAQMEALVAYCLDRADDKVRNRVQSLDAIRSLNAVTVDTSIEE